MGKSEAPRLNGLINRHPRRPPAGRQTGLRSFSIEALEWPITPMGTAQTCGGLRLRTRDLAKLAQLYADGGNWKGARVVSETWVGASTSPHARIDESKEYGYFWWLQSFVTSDPKSAAYYMSGNGGNKVAVFPVLALVVVITSTNFNTKGMHEQTERLLSEYVLPAVAP